MIKKNNIDQLFNKKLGNAKVTPSTAAWDLLESNLKQNKKKVAVIWYKVAAAILLLMVSVFSWWNFAPSQKNIDQMADNITEFTEAPFPKNPMILKIDSDEIIKLYAENQEIIRNNKKIIFSVQPNNKTQHLPNESNLKKRKKVKEFIAIEDSNNKESVNNTSADALIKKSSEAVNQNKKAFKVAELEQQDNKDDLNDMRKSANVKEIVKTADIIALNEENDLPKVTITYKGEETDKVQEKTKSKFSFKKVINSAKKLANGELIADLREAKDGFINSKLKTADD